MNSKNSEVEAVGVDKEDTCTSVCEQVIEKQLEEIVTVLCNAGAGKSRLYGEIMTMIERGLFRIALRRSNNIKSSAAAYLGINRNTFQKKMDKLGLTYRKD